MIFLSVVVISISLIICFTIKAKYRYNTIVLTNQIPIHSRELEVKSKELEIGIYDQYTYCIKTTMRESKNNGKPADLAEAEKVCAKFNTSNN